MASAHSSLGETNVVDVLERMNIIATFFDFLGVFGIHVPVAYRMWILGGLVVLLFPRILKSIYTSQARKILKSSQHYYNEERKALEDKAIQKVINNPHALLGLATDAAQMGRIQLMERLLSLLPDGSKWRRESRQLRMKMEPKKVAPSLDGLLMKIDDLIGDGQYEAAEAHIRRAKLSWPDAEELQARLHHINLSKSS